ncbi:MAG: hypothetical protein R8J41_00430 [Alphaproteobacteria bacterium]|uniref:hypothetical protein n=1 Tax=Pyruvatibacter sp. HU-CL02332 TaxID=3127650 RepID=UPI0029685FA4|nr:hypothetical protein [Alphaproteobacteria bacterium]
MNSIWLFAASGAALVLFLVHVIAGGRAYVRPLMAQPDLPDMIRWMSYMAWHSASVGMAALCLTYGYLAIYGGPIELAVAATLYSVGSALVPLYIAIFGHGMFFRLPAIYGFGTIAAFGALGIAL